MEDKLGRCRLVIIHIDCKIMGIMLIRSSHSTDPLGDMGRHILDSKEAMEVVIKIMRDLVHMATSSSSTRAVSNSKI